MIYETGIITGNKIFKVIDKILGMGITPSDISIERFVELYSILQDTIDLYTKKVDSMSKIGKRNYSEFLLDNLRLDEFEASWTVLREFEDNEKIKSYSVDERNTEFIKRLYSDRKRFLFFNSRENALKKMHKACLINIKDYIHDKEL